VGDTLIAVDNVIYPKYSLFIKVPPYHSSLGVNSAY
jgi:hypothetical protein